jgi:hypothetical protein
MNSSSEDRRPRKPGAGRWRIALAAAIVAALVAWGYAAGLDSPWFAAAAAFTLLGLLDLSRHFVHLPPILGDARPWEARSSAYRLLGVRAFGALLRRFPFRLLNRRVYRVATHDIQALARELEQAEASHSIALLLVALYMLLAAAKGWWPAFAGLATLNLTANLYPILHLRLSRARLTALAARHSRGRPIPTEGHATLRSS